MGYGASYLVAPVFTAKTVFVPPQQQNSASTALASLGALASLTGGGGTPLLKNPGDQYVALLESATIADRMIDRFKLIGVYDATYREQAHKELAKHAQMLSGKKDGLITITVEDHDPARAAAMANQYVDELRQLMSTLAITEAQQRRVFFERQLQDTKAKLTAAQAALQDSGFSLGTLRSEPRSAAEGYARARAEVTASEVRLQILRDTFAENAPEVQQELTRLEALRQQLHSQEQTLDTGAATGQPGYLDKYREFKYQEALFELFARQYELAKVDESREGTLIQVVDPARPPDRKSKPQRAIFALVGLIGLPLLLGAYLVSRARFTAAMRDPAKASRWLALRAALRNG